VRERQQLGGAGSGGATWISRRRKKQYVMWRADSSDLARVYAAEEFTSDERFRRLDDTPAELEAARQGWTSLYNSSVQSRVVFEHVLTGDVLTAWRLVAGTAGPKTDRSKLEIVRALTHPDNVPVVGMRVSEQQLPKLKYVLSCQHQAVREQMDAKAAQQPNVRGVTLSTAEAILQHFERTASGMLPYSSWMDVHKALVDEGVVPKSIEGLRGVQLAVDLLERRKIITVGEKEMVLKAKIDGPLPAGEDLERKLFPGEFFTPADDEDGSGGSDGEASEVDSEALLNDLEQELGLDNDDADDAECHECHDGGHEHHHSKRKREKPEHVAALPTPTKSWKPQDKSTKKQKKREPDAAGKSTGKDDESMFEELFGGDTGQRVKKQRGKKKDKAETEEAAEDQFQPSPSHLKRRRKDMAKALFGDFEFGGEGNSGDEDAEILAELDAAMEDSDDAAAEESAAPETAQPPAETGAKKLWTYEVIGKKLGIRKGPDVATTTVGHLAPGEFFNVTQQVRGKDGRTYLRLADGRGWAYDRSAKDFDKVVVQELAVEPLEGQ